MQSAPVGSAPATRSTSEGAPRRQRLGGALLQAVLQPPFDETLSAAQLRSTAWVHALIIAVSMLVDVVLLMLLWGAPEVRGDALQVFGIANLGLLAVDLVLTLTLQRRPGPLFEPALIASLVIEAITIMVWVQLTGTLSSYFLSVVVMLVVVYRMGFAWRHGVIATLALLLCHATALGLEATGVLPPASLFVDAPAGIYASPGLRAGAAASILSTYLMTLVCANQIVLRMREKDAALARARRELARLMEKVQTGRLSGRLLGDWLLLELLGAGGMGEVYRAQRVSDRTDAAVKVLHPHLAARPDVMERFRRESAVAARLPGCTAGVIELCTGEAAEPFIAWELLRGEDLASFLRRRQQLSLDEVVQLVSGIAHLLGAAHGAGVVHRDLKPSNVFLLEGAPGAAGLPELRLLDFGVAGLLDGSELTETAAVIGSPGYLAPEQARGQHEAVGPHSDVFALGAIAYRALTGKNAFPARDAAAALYEAIHLTPTRATALVGALPADVDAVLALALAKEVRDRYASAADFATDLARAAAGTLDDATRARARPLLGGSVERTLTDLGTPPRSSAPS